MQLLRFRKLKYHSQLMTVSYIFAKNNLNGLAPKLIADNIMVGAEIMEKL